MAVDNPPMADGAAALWESALPTSISEPDYKNVMFGILIERI